MTIKYEVSHQLMSNLKGMLKVLHQNKQNMFSSADVCVILNGLNGCKPIAPKPQEDIIPLPIKPKKNDKNKLLEALEKDGFNIKYGEKTNCVDSKEVNKRYYRSYSLGFFKEEGFLPNVSDEASTEEDAINSTIKNLQVFKKSPLILRDIQNPTKFNGKWTTYIRFYSELFNKKNKNDKK